MASIGDVFVDVSANADNFGAQLERETVSQASEAGDTVGQSFSDSFSESASQAAEAGQQISDEIVGSLAEVSDGAEDMQTALGEAYESMQSGAGDTVTSVDEIASSLGDVGDVGGLGDVSDSLESIGDSAGDAGSSVEELSTDIGSIPDPEVDTTGVQSGFGDATGAVDETGYAVEGVSTESEVAAGGLAGFGAKLKSEWLLVGGAIGGVLALLKEYDDQEKLLHESLGETAITLGISEDKLRDVAAEYSGLYDNVEDVAAAFPALARAGVTSISDIDDVLPLVIQFSDAIGTDIPDAIKLADAGLAPFGKTLGDLADLGDPLVHLFKHTGIEARQFMNQIAKMVPDLDDFDLSLVDVVNILEILDEHGFKGREGMKHLREGFDDASEKSLPALLDAMGVTDDEWERQNKLIDTGSEKMGDYSDNVDESTTFTEMLGNALSSANEDLGSWIITAREWLHGELPVLLTDMFSSIKDMATEAVAKSAVWLTQAGIDMWHGFLHGVFSGASTVRSWMNEHVVAPIIGFFGAAPGWLVSAGRALIAGMYSGVSSKISSVGSWLFAHVASPVIDGVSTAPSWLIEAGKDMIRGLYDGITSTLGDAKHWLDVHVATPIKVAFTSLFGIMSPSKVFHSYGEEVMNGFFAGVIKKNPAGFVENIFGDMAGRAIRTLQLMSGGGEWAGTIARALMMNGIEPTKAHVSAWLRQVQTESGGNPRIHQQIVDINSILGHPAQGLLQTIPPTFQAFKFPGHNDILNGLDNALAAINYAKHRYGAAGMFNVIGHGHGYAMGTDNATPGWHMVGERGPELLRFEGGEQVVPRVNGGYNIGASGDSITVNMSVDASELQDLKRIQDFLDMLSTQRVQSRRRDGSVVA